MGAKWGFRRQLRWLLPVVLVVCVLQLLQGLFSLRSVQVQVLQGENGFADLRQTDLSAGVFRLEARWDFYPDVLYLPEDFAAGRVGRRPERRFLPRIMPAAPTGCGFWAPPGPITPSAASRWTTPPGCL